MGSAALTGGRSARGRRRPRRPAPGRRRRSSAGAELRGVGHGVGGPAAVGAGQPGEVDERIGHAHADPAVLRRAAAVAGDLGLVRLVVVEAAVVVDHHEHRDAVVDGGPQRAGGHEQVAVADDPDAELAAVAGGEGAADEGARPVADPAAAGVPEIAAGPGELPDALGPRAGVAHAEQGVDVAHRLPRLGDQAGRRDGRSSQRSSTAAHWRALRAATRRHSASPAGRRRRGVHAGRAAPRSAGRARAAGRRAAARTARRGRPGRCSRSAARGRRGTGR